MREQARYIEGIQNRGENCGEYRNEENDLNGDHTFEILHRFPPESEIEVRIGVLSSRR